MLFSLLILSAIKHLISYECQSEPSNKYFYEDDDVDNQNTTWSYLVDFKNFSDLILDCNRT